MDFDEKEKLIKKQIKTLRSIFENVDDNKKIFVYNLIEELCFMNVTLKVLKADINHNGAQELFEQGLQKFKRESPSMKSYIALQKNFTNTLKELVTYLPDKKDKTSIFQQMHNALNGCDDE